MEQVIDMSTPFIAAVLVLPKQLAPGDVCYRSAYVGRSAYTPAYCFEVLKIESAPHQAWGTCYIVSIRYDYGGLDVWEWPAWNIAHEIIVGGDKIIRANTEAGAVKKTLAGWVWVGEGE